MNPELWQFWLHALTYWANQWHQTAVPGRISCLSEKNGQNSAFISVFTCYTRTCWAFMPWSVEHHKHSLVIIIQCNVTYNFLAQRSPDYSCSHLDSHLLLGISALLRRFFFRYSAALWQQICNHLPSQQAFPPLRNHLVTYINSEFMCLLATMQKCKTMIIKLGKIASSGKIKQQ